MVSAVWRDEDNLRGGQNWPEALGKAIDESQFFLLAWSKHAADSEPVKNEWNTAVALNKTIIPYLLDQTQLPHSLASKHLVDAKNLGSAITAITSSIHGGHVMENLMPFRISSPHSPRVLSESGRSRELNTLLLRAKRSASTEPGCSIYSLVWKARSAMRCGPQSTRLAKPF